MTAAARTHRSIIDKWPDLFAFARDAGVNINVAKAMRHRGWIPGWYWWRLVRAAEQRGIERVNLERLAKLADSRPTPTKLSDQR